MKIIHTADLHLYSALSANLSADKSKLRRAEILKTFRRMCEYAKSNAVEAIIISGDFFDTEVLPQRSVESTYNIIREFNSIKFFYLKGNHDFNLIFKNVPENLHIFKNTFEKAEVGEAVIGGFTGTPSCYGEIDFSEDKVNILMLHGDIDKKEGEDSVEIKSLVGRGIDYIALGHIHSFKDGRLDERTRYAYSGCPDGRGYDECGKKGFVLINVTDKSLSYEFVEFQSRIIDEVKADITGCETNFDVFAKTDVALAGLDESSIVKLVLVGRLTEENDISFGYIEERYRDNFFGFKLSDKTAVFYDPEKYKYDDTLKGEFVRYVLNSDCYSDEEKRKITEIGIKAINGEALI